MKRGGWWPHHGVAVCGLGCAGLAVVAWTMLPRPLADGVVAVTGLLAGFVAGSRRRPGVPEGPLRVAVVTGGRRAEEERGAFIPPGRAARAQAGRRRDFPPLGPPR